MKKCRRLLNETNKVRMDHMTEDFYCDEVFSGKTKVNKVLETDNVLATIIQSLFIQSILWLFLRNIFPH